MASGQAGSREAPTLGKLVSHSGGGTVSAATTPSDKGLDEQARELLALYRTEVRALLAEHHNVGLEALDRQADVLQRALERRTGVTIGVVGEAQVGKSTLVNALLGRNALPAGGIGPLTAQATRVCFGDVNTLSVAYHGVSDLKKLRFLIESYLHRRGELEGVVEGAEEHAEDAQQAAIEQDLPSDGDGAQPSRMKQSRLGEHMLAQAQLMLLGRKAPKDFPRAAILDGLRAVLGQRTRSGSDLAALQGRVYEIFAKLGQSEQISESTVTQKDFNGALRERVVDWLSPLVRSLEVRLNSEMLRDVTIVDLPGVGVVGDPAARVAEDFVRREGDALVLVARNSGITTPLAQLLENANVITKLLFGARPGVAPIQLVLAITHLDDVADSRYCELRQEATEAGEPLPKREVVFAELARAMEEEARHKLGAMLRESDAFHGLPEDLRARREEIVKSLTGSLRVVCVVAPDFIKLTYGGIPDEARLKTPESTGIPALREAVTQIAAESRERRTRAIAATTQGLRKNVLDQLNALGRWLQTTQGAATAEWERFRKDLSSRAEALKKELAASRVEARQALDRNIPGVIKDVCSDAGKVAEARLAVLAEQSRKINFMTLNAALRRSGVYGERGVDIPGALSRSLVDAVASAWEPKIIRILRVVVERIAQSDTVIVRRLCDEAKRRGHECLADEVLSSQEPLLLEDARSAVTWTDERLEVLRDSVQESLSVAVLQPIDEACKAAIKAGTNRGTGARDRISQEFAEGGRRGVERGKAVAVELLMSEYKQLAQELEAAYLGSEYDPLTPVLESLTHSQQQDATDRVALWKKLNDLATRAGGTLVAPEPKPVVVEVRKHPTGRIRPSERLAAVQAAQKPPAPPQAALPPKGSPAAQPAPKITTASKPPATPAASVSSKPADAPVAKAAAAAPKEALQPTKAPATTAAPVAKADVAAPKEPSQQVKAPAPVPAPTAGMKIVVSAPTTPTKNQSPISSAAIRVTPTRVAKAGSLSALLEASELWARQEGKLPRHVPKATFFMILDGLGASGALSFVEVGRIGLIEPRNVPGMIAEASRALNVEGQEVLRADRVSQRVELNLDLLRQVFEIKQGCAKHVERCVSCASPLFCPSCATRSPNHHSDTRDRCRRCGPGKTQ